MTYLFGPFRADRTAYRVSRGDEPVELTPKLLDLLFYMLERPAALVTKEELLDGVWPDANVTDNALAQAMSELREALGDRAASPTYIRTIARRGYRWIAPVEAVLDAGPGVPASPGAGAVPRSIAVLDFTNLTGDADVAWLAAGIAETVSSDLGRLNPFRVVDRWRVRQEAIEAGEGLAAAGQALGAALVVIGSFQRRGARLRISARMVDVAGGEAVADAKVDGLVDDVFSLQDGIVSALARQLGIEEASPASGGHETSSLEAYRAHTEGWLRLESLNTELVPAAIEDFERAIRADPAFAQAFAGLASAEFVAFEMTRQTRDLDREALARGIAHAEHAIQLAPGLAEAHATLSFLLAGAGRYDEAQAAARRAVALEPESWRHQYRLGHATWGTARLRALERAIALYPQFAYARFEMAMVHVARREFDMAERLVRQGAVEQDLQKPVGNRFPGVGFHWLLGAVLAARGRHTDAIAEFDRELARADRRRLYGPEYGMVALYWRGASELALDRPDEARASFSAMHGFIDGHSRAWLGQARALRETGDHPGAARALDRAREARRAATGRTADVHLYAAFEAAETGDATAAIRNLEAILALPVGPPGWTIPLEPALAPVHGTPQFERVLTRLADRAS